MKIGKYITNIGVITSIIGAFGVYRQTERMPSDFRKIIVWVVWALGVVLAIASVAKDDEHR